jgi:hypothetical protein
MSSFSGSTLVAVALRLREQADLLAPVLVAIWLGGPPHHARHA